MASLDLLSIARLIAGGGVSSNVWANVDTALDANRSTAPATEETTDPAAETGLRWFNMTGPAGETISAGSRRSGTLRRLERRIAQRRRNSDQCLCSTVKPNSLSHFSHL